MGNNFKGRAIASAFFASVFLFGCSQTSSHEDLNVSSEPEDASAEEELSTVQTSTTESNVTETTSASEITEASEKAVISDNELTSLQHADEIIKASTSTSDIFTERDLTLTPDLSDVRMITLTDNSSYRISEEGVYYLTGSAENFTVSVDADKNDKIQIVLENTDIDNVNFPAIYIISADKCFISAIGENSLSVSGIFESDGDTNTDAVIYSKDDLVLNGTGTLTIDSPYGNGISAKDDFKATGGKYYINCALDGIEVNDSISICGGEFNINSQKDAFHCENSDDDTSGSVFIENGAFILNAASDGIQAVTALQIDGGNFNISAAEGLESTYIQINGGDIYIESSDDGINAAGKSSAYDVLIEFNGGNTTIVMGAGDTDGVDSNGNIIVNGGTIDVTGNSAFDYDGGAQYNGGTIIVNGVQVDSIPQSMMGGKGGRHKGGVFW